MSPRGDSFERIHSFLHQVTGLRTETAWLDSLEMPSGGQGAADEALVSDSLQNTAAFGSTERANFHNNASHTLSNAEYETPREDAEMLDSHR